jgi:nucleotide-binding universal stress UspA family protein
MEPIRNIFVAVAPSPTSIPALEVAKSLATRNGARLRLQPVASDRVINSCHVPFDLRNAISDAWSVKLRELAAEAGVDGAEPDPDVTFGAPLTSIASEARRMCPDLIVMGDLSSLDIWRKRSMGRTTYKAFRDTPVPTLLVGKTGNGGPPKDVGFDRMLAAVDVAAGDLDVLAYAASLKPIFRSELHVLHVCSPRDDSSERKSTLEGLLAEHFSPEERGAVDALWVRRAADPAAEILRFAEDLEIDLIAFGSRSRRRFLGTRCLGKVASGVVRGWGCSLLAVRQPASPH